MGRFIFPLLINRAQRAFEFPIFFCLARVTYLLADSGQASVRLRGIWSETYGLAETPFGFPQPLIEEVSLSERFVGLTQLCPAFFIRTGVIRCAEFYFTFVMRRQLLVTAKFGVGTSQNMIGIRMPGLQVRHQPVG